jgi:hypothetical protein
MATNTYVALDRVTGNGSASYIEFTNIPQGYTDLVLVVQAKSTTGAQAWDIAYVQVGNGSVDTGTNYSWTRIRGDGSTATSTRATNQVSWSLPASGTDNVGSTVGELHIQNYSNTTTFKTSLGKQSATDVIRYANLWRSTSAITNIKIYSYTGSAWASSSIFTLYGISNAGDATPKATGGDVTSDANYWYHAFTMSGNFVPNQTLSCDYLVVAGGGAGGASGGAGGGAGGFRTATAQSITAGTYQVLVGGGGSGVLNSKGTNGSDSTFNSFTSTGGGAASGVFAAGGTDANNGGSGGGGNYNKTVGLGNTPSTSPSQGNNGGGSTTTNNLGTGGGGGAGAVGGTGTPTDCGVGGAGTASSMSGTSVTYAGGGGGGGSFGATPAAGGSGGGGAGSTGAATSGTTNTGGGGGGSGSGAGGNGGSGIVIIRYAK